jgi:hypothetical protein
MSRPLLITGTVVATYLGAPIRKGIGRDTEFRAFANMPQRTGAVGVYSQSAGEFGFQYDPENQLKISSKREFSPIQLRTQVDYAVRDRAVGAQVTRQLASQWSTTVGARLPVDGAAAEAVPAQANWRVDFGVQF